MSNLSHIWQSIKYFFNLVTWNWWVFYLKKLWLALIDVVIQLLLFSCYHHVSLVHQIFQNEWFYCWRRGGSCSYFCGKQNHIFISRFLDKMIKIVMLLLIYSSHSVLYKPENPITHSASIMHLWSKHFQLWLI